MRRVLGSSVAQLFVLITREFLLLVGLANLVIWPIIYWLMQQWLTGFAARTEINTWLFLASLGVSLVFMLLIISWQTLRAATVNPAAVLRSE
ncbi:MAG: FtsX-like permease family protein [Bacteroidota bacterium]